MLTSLIDYVYPIYVVYECPEQCEPSTCLLSTLDTAGVICSNIRKVR